MAERLIAAFMAGICACQAAKWARIATREFLLERAHRPWLCMSWQYWPSGRVVHLHLPGGDRAACPAPGKFSAERRP